MPQVIETGTSNITHWIDADGTVERCSEAQDFMHYNEDGTAHLTGFGFCFHYEDDDGAPIVVRVGA